MLVEYMQKAIERAEYKRLEDNTSFAEIPGFEGVWPTESRLRSAERN
jgi:hypothetical protein